MACRARKRGNGAENPIPLAEKRHIHPTLGTARLPKLYGGQAQDRNQGQQQNLIKRIKHFPFLAGIVKTRKMLKKINTFKINRHRRLHD